MKIGLVCLNQNGGSVFPVGLLSITAMLHKRHPEYQVEIIDSNFEDPFIKTVEGTYDVIGISSMTIEYEKATLLAQHIKKHASVPIVLGGVHISSLSQSFRSCFDVGVIGEGEETFCELMSTFAISGHLNPQDISHIKGLIYRDDDKLITTTPRGFIDPLDEIPQLNYSLLNPAYFKHRPLSVWGKVGRQGVILTSRGCPYKCVFCSTTQFWHKVRCFAVERIIDEIVDLVENYKVDHIQIMDDLFTLNKKRLKLFADEFRRRALHEKVSLACQSRTNLIDDELCNILVSINVKLVSFGFESGNERMLRYLKCDSTTVEQNKTAIALCVKYKLKVFGSVIFGSPTETLDEMEDTVRFIRVARAMGVYCMWAFLMTPFPGTQMWDIAKKKGKVSDDMNFDLLNLSSTYLLLEDSVDRNKFNRIWRKARWLLFYYPFKMLYPLIKKHPLSTTRSVAEALLRKYMPRRC